MACTAGPRTVIQLCAELPWMGVPCFLAWPQPPMQFHRRRDSQVWGEGSMGVVKFGLSLEFDPVRDSPSKSSAKLPGQI